MQVLPVQNFNKNNNSFRNTTNVNFKSAIDFARPTAGIVKRDTKVLFSDIMHAYGEIKEVLERKSDKGLEHLMQVFPNITIKGNLIFYNCGENNSAISIRVAESNKYRGLVHLSRRILDKATGRYKTVEAFMFDGKEKLIKDFSPNHSNRFPNVRNYFSQEEIEKDNLDEKITKLLNDLDGTLLKFRLVLAKNSNNYLKTPDGKIPYEVASQVRSAFNICDEITKSTNKIPHKMLLAINKNFPDYLAVTGLKTYAFKNLGEDNLTINLSSIEKDGEEFKRLTVYDSENKPFKTFLIKNDEKFVSNLTQAYPNNFPRKLAYANIKEMEKEYLPEFNKYFSLYLEKLKEYQNVINKNVDKYFYKDIDGEISDNVHNLFDEAAEWYEISKVKLRKLPNPVAARIRSTIAEMALDSGSKGAWFNGLEGNKTVNLLPVTSEKHSGLYRLTIINNDTKETKMYLIKDFKYIVKNFNPKYPTIIPDYLFYINEGDMKDLDLENCARFLKMRLEQLATVADEAFEHRFEKKIKIPKNPRPSITKKPRIERKPKEKNIFKTREYQRIAKECKEQFNEALKNLSSGMDNFNATIQSIQEKLAEFCKEQ